MGKFKISCDEATTICDRNQYGEAKLIDKIKLSFHLVKCKICNCYSKQNNMMTKVYKDYSKNQCEKPKCLSTEERQKIEEAVKEKMN